MRNLIVLICLPLLATLTGTWIACNSGTSYYVFLPNFGVLPLFVILLFQSTNIVEFSVRRANRIFWLALVVICASLFAPGIDSVHRWISLGPHFRLNVSMAFVPILLFTSIYSHQIWTPVGMGCLSLIYVLQPDAGQATAFASAAIIILSFDRSKWVSLRIGASLIFIVLTIIAWTRPDPLPQIPHVEQIVRLAYSQGPLTITAVLFAIALLMSPFVWILLNSTSPPEKAFARSSLCWFSVSYLVTELGNFPVPVIGAGAAPVLGWCICMIFLLHQHSKRV